ncbi:MAG: restriction endonuclease subunit S [Prevotella sp.]|jgi:type I restriction enzyme S subunit|nr:restriction endonuclease subunit S [Prevotella sp.]
MSKYPLVPLIEMADIYDHLREPVSEIERNKRAGLYPYYGATGQIGLIDGYRQDGKYVLLGEDGAPFLDPNKPKAFIVEGKCWVNNHAHVLKGKLNICNDDYLCIALNFADYSNAVTGSTRLKLPQNMMGNLLIPKPSIEEQKRIVKIYLGQLAEIEKARETTEIINQDIKRLKHLVLHDFFSEFHEVEKFKLGVKAVTTSGSTPPRGQTDYWQPEEIPWIKTGEIAFAQITKSEEYISNKALKECSLKLLPEKTVLIAMYGQGKTRGQSAILEIPATINQACFAILPNETWEPEFLQLWLMYSYQELRNMSENRGGNQANLNGDLLNSFEVPAPSLEVQRKVVKKINTALAELEIMKVNWLATTEEITKLPTKILAEVFNEIENG